VRTNKMAAFAQAPKEDTPTHDKCTAGEFLVVLDPAARKFTFQFFSDWGDGYPQVFHGSLDEVWPKIEALNTPANGMGVFVAINETDLKGRKTENIARARTLCADADNADQLSHALNVLQENGATPTMVVQTSQNRAHFYFCCDDIPLERFSECQTALAEKLGTDPAVKDLPRVMRLAGTLHLKDPNNPQKVILKKSSKPRRWNIDELAAALDLQVAQTAAAPGMATGTARPKKLTPKVNPPPTWMGIPIFTPADAERLRRKFGSHLADDISAGIDCVPNWFSALPPASKFEVVKACLNAFDNRTSDPREAWLRSLFAVADAERLGCPNARQLALEWSRRGASWTTENEFDTAWNSFKPGGISVGSLLASARDAGMDLSRWRDQVLQPTLPPQLAAQAAGAIPSTATISPRRRAISTTALPPVPPKRRWLHGTDLVRGAVSLLVAPGARGKSSWLVTLALACASNRLLLGSKVYGGPLRVLLISAEDPLSELTLRIRAAMQHHGLTDADVPGLYVIGADNWGIPLLRPGTNGPTLNTAGWDELIAELNHLEPDILIIDPLISVMGGASQNDNAAAALFMGQLVGLAAKHGIAVMVAHHSAKGRDPISAESAMGAASFVNLSRITLGIEPLAEKDAGSVGLPPWEARNVFRLVSTKANRSPPSEGDRWYRHRSVEMNNAQPPIYPNGDKVGVVEVFQPSASAATYSTQIITSALAVIHHSPVPLSPSKRATGRYAVPLIAQAIARHRGGRASDAEAQAILEHVIRTGLAVVQQVKLARAGSRSDLRSGLVLTTAGKQHLDAEHPSQSDSKLPAIPASPATSIRDDAGGDPSGPPQHKGGMGGNAGGIVAGPPRTEPPSTPLQQDGSSLPRVVPPELASVDFPAQPPEPATEPPPTSTEPGVGSDSRSSLPTQRTSPRSDAPPPLTEDEYGPATITLESKFAAGSPCLLHT
jgi:hypothetical protein